jgi:hypothetical protein
VKRVRLGEDTTRADLAYWLSRPPHERIEAVERLRRLRHGDPGRLRRVARVVRREPCEQLRILTDIEA